MPMGQCHGKLIENLRNPLDGLGRQFGSDTGGENSQQRRWGIQAQEHLWPTSPNHAYSVSIATKKTFKRQSSIGHCQTKLQKWLPPCPLVIALMPLKYSGRNLQSHRVLFTREKCWCPYSFKNKAYRPDQVNNTIIMPCEIKIIVHISCKTIIRLK